MSSTTLAQKGMKAVTDCEWDQAVPLLTAALKQSRSPLWLLARSKAHIGLKEFSLALADADEALLVARERANRSLMIEAQYRRAVALYRLGRLADADCCCVWAQSLIKGRPASYDAVKETKLIDDKGFYGATKMAVTALSQVDMADERRAQGEPQSNTNKPAKPPVWNQSISLRLQILTALEARGPEDNARKPTVLMYPAKKEVEEKAKVEQSVSGDSDSDASVFSPPAGVSTMDTGKSKEVPFDVSFKSDWYQSSAGVTVSLYQKGLPTAGVSVDFQKDVVIVRPFRLPDGSEGQVVLHPAEAIKPEASTFRVDAAKVELRLGKAVPARWGSPTKNGVPIKVTSIDNYIADAIATDGPTAASQQPAEESKKAEEKPTKVTKEVNSEPTSKMPATTGPPSYPTSSKTGPKNWDKLEDGDDDKEEDQDVNFFFKKLYKGATAEQQRAMMKSFIESNGTALSTDWNDVKGRTVETVPPEGVEAKKWS